MWYLAACLAGHHDTLEYRHPMLAVRNSAGVVTGACEIVRGSPGSRWVVRGKGWWARAVHGTATVSVDPIDVATLATCWRELRGKANAVAMFPPDLRFRRVEAMAGRAGVEPAVAARLLSWADPVEDFFSRPENRA
jgi:hypothetical protein